MKELWTALDDRVLRYDGVSIVDPEQVVDLFMRGLQPNQLRVTAIGDDELQFNAQVADTDKLRVFTDAGPISLNFDWQLPPEYLTLDVEQHVSVVFGERLPGLAYDSAQTETAINRVALELSEFERRGLTDLLRVIIFVLARFRESGQVYGVGRGSSCASFVLFLLGLHVVDPIRYNVPLEEFMHD